MVALTVPRPHVSGKWIYPRPSMFLFQVPFAFQVSSLSVPAARSPPCSFNAGCYIGWLEESRNRLRQGYGDGHYLAEIEQATVEQATVEIAHQ